MGERLVEGHGVIVAEFFDVACSRQVPWAERPQAGLLLAALADPDRGFDAVVVGEYERAFDAGQFDELLPVLEAHGVQLWLPETGGPVEFGSVMHQALMTVLGAQSRREVLRARHRAMAAMRTQAVDQGRYLGGRPPYGYRLVDAGAHPTRAHARWGRQLQRLAPDPVTAPHVRWIFAERGAGRSAASIARELNERGVPCPSSNDPTRNRHRSNTGWSLRTIIEIVENPRYTGRQVWGRTSTDRRHRSVTGRRPSTRRDMGEWAVSTKLAHEPLVSEGEFVNAQLAHTPRTSDTGVVRTYRLAGLVRCGLCGRRMDSHWVHGRAGYRCRHGRTSAQPAVSVAKSWYAREDRIVELIRDQLTNHGTRPMPDLDPVEVIRSSASLIEYRPGSITLNGPGTTSGKRPDTTEKRHADAKTNNPTKSV
ncbi:Recombinase zinc beta ribbon domain-containing protein [Actinokineospora alba]|uniref:Recombinase zinc beta ribbon domain-containing protein n=1 Tax=Actinokineospora alba TaxID=504798 RepID=A0A1H0FKI8_9PSEU|nr:recombinase family protein [Actinokineospora alba]TDP69516.1 recombinase-like zinc beta ribbon protein [Actinokineospora alba]SDI15072.1 Recombinase zinc beta ribbon domain-containing protein [Actinokineospora alba]SDN95134.1 Recombinase zinc beta ribbon domain-containing protein [Actinokineospora alba]